MQNLPFRLLIRLRESYWFWPSVLTVGAIVLGIVMPILDRMAGTAWSASLTFIHTSEPEGARAILTTLASAILGVGGVAFSITIVAVSFASSNYGPRLIGNFMGDRINQFVLGTFVATFVYCIVVLTTVHDASSVEKVEIGQFVPQLSIYCSLVLGLVCIAAMIAYIHHIPESINIMNLTQAIGARLCQEVTAMLDEEVARDRERADADAVAPWHRESDASDRVLRALHPGYVQHFHIKRLDELAHEHSVQVVLERSPGDFVATGEPLMAIRPAEKVDEALMTALSGCLTLGAERTDLQDVLFLSDQLVEVLVRALSPGINDPNTAMLCLDWLRAGLVDFARRAPARPPSRYDAVLYSRVTFETMLDRSFDRMRQHIARDRTVTLYAMAGLADIAIAARSQAMADACARQLERLGQAAVELQPDSVERAEVEAALKLERARNANRATKEIGGSERREP